MDKKFALRRSTIINKNKKFLTRLGYVYEDPKISLSNYLVGGLNLYQICNKCINGKLEPEFRGILYKMFLNLIPFNEPQVWLKYLTESRNAYKSITKELIDSNVNILPFMNCEEKKGTETYEKFSKLIPQEDYELIGLIKLDVDRTFQELDLFHNKKIKGIYYPYPKILITITIIKKIIPTTIVALEITFSGPLSFILANKPKSPEPVKALSPSDLPPCNNDNKINTTATTNNNISNIIFTSRRATIIHYNHL